jgi:hypothetical protein
MKRINLLLIVFIYLTFSFVGCKGKTKEELILGKWKIDMSAKETIHQIEKASNHDEKMKTNLESAFEATTMEFSNNKICTFSMMGKSSNSNYQIINDGKYIEFSFNESGSNSTAKSQIVELSENKLKFIDENGDTSVLKK